MANRFQYKEKNLTSKKFFFTLLVFILVAELFFYGINSLSSRTIERQKESLESSVKSIVAYCYAMEGAYPDSVDYMEKNYGLTYNKEKFFVGYQVSGANILPDITVIELEN